MFLSGELFSSMSTADLPTQSAVLDQIKDWKIQYFFKDNAGACLVGGSSLFDSTELHLSSEDPPDYAGIQVQLKIMQEYRCGWKSTF